MTPRLSPVQIDEKLERLHKFVCDHVGLLASRDGASLRQCLRQTASAEEGAWYFFLCKNANAFSESQNDRVRQAYALLEEQWSSVAPRAAVLPEPAATMLAELPGPVAESSTSSMFPHAVVLPEPAAEHPAHKKARRKAASAVVAAQVATRDSGAGEPAGGSDAPAGVSTPKGENASERSDGGDKVAVETRGTKRGKPLPRSVGRAKTQKVVGAGRADSSSHAQPQESLTWYMSPKIDDVHVPRARPLCFDDIVNIEDASLFARDHASRLPAELLRRVWHVRGNLTHRQTTSLARHFAVRTKWKMNG
jgi:hypothetical protein